MYRHKISEWIYLVLFWCFVLVGHDAFITSITSFNLESMGVPKDVIAHDFHTSKAFYHYVPTLIDGVLVGIWFVIINSLVEMTPLHKRSTWIIVLIKTVLYVGSIIGVLIISDFLTRWMLPAFFFPRGAFTQLHAISENLLTYVLMFSFFILLANFFVLVRKKYGPGNLFPIFMGYYHHPKVEFRIFMFMDLRSSTSYAEELGHILYSELIQDCFAEINLLAPKYRAGIYQYVGDEVVLIWREKEGLQDLNCIRVFFAMEDALKKKEAHFKRKYGFLPEFKVGLNGGELTAVEVGDFRREIAFHGDVINTAARIQGQCNILNKSFLVSKDLLDRLPDLGEHKAVPMGMVDLKGKEVDVPLFSLERSEKREERPLR